MVVLAGLGLVSANDSDSEAALGLNSRCGNAPVNGPLIIGGSPDNCNNTE